ASRRVPLRATSRAGKGKPGPKGLDVSRVHAVGFSADQKTGPGLAPLALIMPNASTRSEPCALVESAAHPAIAVETPAAVRGPMATGVHCRPSRESHARAAAPLDRPTLPTTAVSEPMTHTPLASSEAAIGCGSSGTPGP